MGIDLRFLPHALLLWRNNPIQALLSTLGIVTGVIGLILVIALGTGARRELETALGSLGAGTVIVKRKPDTAQALTTGHLAAMERLLAGQLSLLSPAIVNHQTVSSAAARRDNIRVVATNRQHQQLQGAVLHRGRYLADVDLVNREPVCVLGWHLGKALFPRGQVVGEQVRLDLGWCRVVGWLAPAALSASSLKPLGLTEIDNGLFVPLSVLAAAGPAQHLDEIAFRATQVENLGTLLAVVRSIVRHSGDGIDYIVPIQVLQQQQELQRLFQYVLLVVSGLMLVVGGVGIMNVMLVNVVSRRAEIGLRRAIGATPQDILQQFFTESLVVAVAGGLIGLVLGSLLALAIDHFTAWPMAISPQGLITGFAVAVIIGLIFGSYPALQAASLAPVRALNPL